MLRKSGKKDPQQMKAPKLFSAQVMQDMEKPALGVSFCSPDDKILRELEQIITSRGGTIKWPGDGPADFLVTKRATPKRRAIAEKGHMATITPAKLAKIIDDRAALKRAKLKGIKALSPNSPFKNGRAQKPT